MIVIVKQHEILLKKEEEINEKEVNVSKCIFEFDEEITDEFIKEAIFVKDDKTIVKIINNNECDYPPEILDSVGTCLLGVVATLTEGEEIVKRFNPTPKKFFITEGILREADNSEPITASELEQYQQALQNGLNEVKAELQRVIETGNTVASQGQYAQEQGGYAKEQAQTIIDSNAAATKIIKEFEENVEQHTTNFNENATTQTTNYNDNAKEKLETYNSNAETKTTDFNKNASDKTKTFNENVETKTTDYNANSEVKIKAYDDNAIAKLKEYNDNATLKVEEYNSNATEKLENYNSNATAKTEEFNQNASNYEKRITENEKDIVDIESYLDSLTPKAPPVKGELVHITDALGLPTFGTKTSGNVKQETTKGTNEFNAYAITNAKIVVGEDGKTITMPLIESGNGIVSTNKKLGELCPNLKVGDVIYLYFDRNLTSHNTFIYLLESNYIWYRNTSRTITETDLDSEVNLYGNRAQDGETQQAILTDFQITKVQNAPWEKFTYGASPNPEFPQEIEVVEAHNKFNINTITENKYIDGATGEIANSSASNISDYIEIEANKKFTLLFKYNSLANTGNRTIAYYDANKNFLNGIVYNPANKPITFTTPNDAKFVRFSYDKNIYDIQLVKGTKEKPYNPFSCISYKVNGKNLFSGLIKGIRIYASNGVQYNDNTGATSDYIPLDITGSNKFIISGLPTNLFNFICAYNSNKEFLGRTGEKSDDTMSLTISSFPSGTPQGTGDIAYIRVTSYENPTVTGTIDDIDNSTILLEKGITATNYEPYQEQIVSLDLKGNFVGKLSDTIKDYLVTDKKKYWLVKNVGKVVFNGSESWWLQSGIEYRVKLNNSKFYGKALSNYFINSENKTNGSMLIYQAGYLRIYKDSNSLEEFKQWLSENNVEVVYQLATPEIIELGELPEPIKTFEGTNNIQVLANLDTEIEVKYALDLQKKYDNKIAELSAQII